MITSITPEVVTLLLKMVLSLLLTMQSTPNVPLALRQQVLDLSNQTLTLINTMPKTQTTQPTQSSQPVQSVQPTTTSSTQTTQTTQSTQTTQPSQPTSAIPPQAQAKVPPKFLPGGEPRITSVKDKDFSIQNIPQTKELNIELYIDKPSKATLFWEVGDAINTSWIPQTSQEGTKIVFNIDVPRYSIPHKYKILVENADGSMEWIGKLREGLR